MRMFPDPRTRWVGLALGQGIAGPRWGFSWGWSSPWYYSSWYSPYWYGGYWGGYWGSYMAVTGVVTGDLPGIITIIIRTGQATTVSDIQTTARQDIQDILLPDAVRQDLVIPADLQLAHEEGLPSGVGRVVRPGSGAGSSSSTSVRPSGGGSSFQQNGPSSITRPSRGNGKRLYTSLVAQRAGAQDLSTAVLAVPDAVRTITITVRILVPAVVIPLLVAQAALSQEEAAAIAEVQQPEEVLHVPAQEVVAQAEDKETKIRRSFEL